ncbi:hypothetical protein DEU56DRAFT_877216 [Suillus clintonianus]|uniref:uncharacterized protein n=1 Tax=Suillus clintonianus TaxID=1904413 RepID=UPI001B87F1D0|nr:uncharacterized protein DEU56DRAFT_877216 [Suillus clintonianus]KAG2155644.1 hypothetical protein DEU56DRAFT_877216 [Suillus clintonianus]
MSFRALFYAYVLGGLTFIPLAILIIVGIAIYTSIPVQIHSAKDAKPELHTKSTEPQAETEDPTSSLEVNDQPRTRKGWLTMRRTFEESTSSDGSYVTLVRSYLDARSKDPKRSRPKDMWYVVLKGKVLYMYEDESRTECEAAIELGGHEVCVYPDGLLDGELFTKRNAICLRPRPIPEEKGMPSVTKEMALQDVDIDEKVEEAGGSSKKQINERERLVEEEKQRDAARQEAFSTSTPWFIFVRSCVEMEDWYLALIHASENPTGTPTLNPLQNVFLPSEMNQLVVTLDEQPDVIPMRWLNALLGRIFFSFYRTQTLESYIIGRLMKKVSKVKRPAFLTDISVTEFSIGNKAPTLSKPMLKELTKEGDASLEVRLSYKGEVRATVQATVIINLGARFKSYTVKLVLAVILREIEGNLLIKVKRPPSSRIWYAFTQTPRVVLDVEPIVSDRQITLGMILDTIKSRIIEVIQESVVMPNMDDISFFDSSPYIHRGGLWSDAARREQSEPAPTSSDVEGVKPAASESDLPSVPGTSEEVTAPSIKRAVSTEDLGVEASLFEGMPVIRPATTVTSDKNIKASRRRSWFSSGGDESDVCEEVEESDVRGRQSRASSSSTPRQDLSANPDKPAGEMELDDETPGYLSPQYNGRSSSTHSQARSRSSRADSFSSSVSVGGDESLNGHSDSGAASKSPRASVGSNTASSFLSTLKSKAADKQALSNSAKEAMRKWGVNWGGLKKDNSANSQDDVPDVGPSDARTRTESTHGRPSYAEVRAAVAGRKERRDDGGSAPIPIPNGKRSTSPSSGYMASSSGAPASPPHITQGGSSEGSSSSKFVAPSLSRSATESDPLKDRDFTDITEEHRRPSIIHTQPSQARTMTIPGIHASHRGEPMSMGNIAPSSAPPESKPMGPAIQSMYRLWKSPILTGQQQGSENQSTPTRADTEERNADVLPLSLSAEVASPPPRSVPPPLPPRTISSAIAVPRTPDLSKDSTVPSVSFASDEMRGASPVQGSSDPSPELAETSAPVGIPELVIAKGPDNRPPLPPRRIQTPA